MRETISTAGVRLDRYDCRLELERLAADHHSYQIRMLAGELLVLLEKERPVEKPKVPSISVVREGDVRERTKKRETNRYRMFDIVWVSAGVSCTIMLLDSAWRSFLEWYRPGIID